MADVSEGGRGCSGPSSRSALLLIAAAGLASSAASAASSQLPPPPPPPPDTGATTSLRHGYSSSPPGKNDGVVENGDPVTNNVIVLPPPPPPQRHQNGRGPHPPLTRNKSFLPPPPPIKQQQQYELTQVDSSVRSRHGSFVTGTGASPPPDADLGPSTCLPQVEAAGMADNGSELASRFGPASDVERDQVRRRPDAFGDSAVSDDEMPWLDAAGGSLKQPDPMVKEETGSEAIGQPAPVHKQYGEQEPGKGYGAVPIQGWRNDQRQYQHGWQGHGQDQGWNDARSALPNQQPLQEQPWQLQRQQHFGGHYPQAYRQEQHKWRTQQQQPKRSSPMFGGILKRLERGMDAVVSIEDAVDKRARSFGRTVKYATTGQMSVRDASAASAAGSRTGLKIQRIKERIARQAPDIFDLLGDDIRDAEQQIEAAEAVAVTDGVVTVPTPFSLQEQQQGGDPSPRQDEWGGSLLSDGNGTSDVDVISQHDPLANLLQQVPGSPSGTSSGHLGQNPPTQQSYTSYKDEEDERTPKSLRSRKLTFIPSPSSLIPSRGLFSKDGDSIIGRAADWSDDEDDAIVRKGGKKHRVTRPSTNTMTRAVAGQSASRNHPFDDVPQVVSHLLERGGPGKMNLLSKQNGNQCHRLGQTKSFLDIAALAFLLFSIRELTPYVSSAFMAVSMTDFLGRDGPIPVIGNFDGYQTLFRGLRASLSDAFIESWAPLSLASALLSVLSNDVFLRPAIRRTASAVAGSVYEQVRYSQMFLRLVTGQQLKALTSDTLAEAARHQVLSDVETIRLRSFITMVMMALVALTISVVKPICGAIVGAGSDIFMLEAWRQWPLAVSEVGEGTKTAFVELGTSLLSLLRHEWDRVAEYPMGIAVQGSLFLALATVTALPMLAHHSGQKRTAACSVDPIANDDDQRDPFVSDRSTEKVADIGISSSSRLSLLSQTGAVEGTLERWMLTQTKSNTFRSGLGGSVVQIKTRSDGVALLQRAAFESLVAIILCLPIVLYTFVVPSISDSSTRWSTGLQLGAILSFAFGLFRNALLKISHGNKFETHVASFLGGLDGVVTEILKANKSQQADLQVAAAASPTKGIRVTDFWVAHSAQSAWACRGASLHCQAGQVLVILGEDGSGKSRLMTALAESIVAPPEKSRSTVQVRGSISLGGMDVTQWDRKKLRRSVGFVLNDIRTLSDMAQLLSGCTLEEILEPDTSGMNGSTYGSTSRNAIKLATQITGLNSGLMTRLPLKLSTVVTANEDELVLSDSRPSAQMLSPPEWAKVLLTRTVATAIQGNDNPLPSPDATLKCLVGSILLLDDVTAHSSEGEEAALINSLRNTGAAALLVSNRWGAGRLADRIIVMKDGSVVESGTHDELISRGPQNSVYASKWNDMAN